jgi:methylated-DNA-protein-cysteine methyltransferase related protein
MKENLSQSIVALIRSIPRGKVATYGQIAALAGNPRAARQVARILHALSEKENLPWHRVINRLGKISLPMDGTGSIQARLLQKEKITVDGQGTVNLDKYNWRPRQ